MIRQMLIGGGVAVAVATGAGLLYFFAIGCLIALKHFFPPNL
jgi:hypothetical protein